MSYTHIDAQAYPIYCNTLDSTRVNDYPSASSRKRSIRRRKRRKRRRRGRIHLERFPPPDFFLPRLFVLVRLDNEQPIRRSQRAFPLSAPVEFLPFPRGYTEGFLGDLRGIHAATGFFRGEKRGECQWTRLNPSRLPSL